MKIRTGFVANSSSSSFIVIQEGNRQYILQPDDNILIVDGSNGEYEFGWENTVYRDVYSKINFAFLQSEYAERDDWKMLLEEVIKEETGVEAVEWKLTTGYGNAALRSGYIDHQSASVEGENIEMFDSKENLKQFLFSDNSYIQGGNDNE